VIINNNDGQAAASLVDGIFYSAPPTLVALTPPVGPNRGLNTIYLHGLGFNNPAVVRFGGQQSGMAAFESATRLRVTVPVPAGPQNNAGATVNVQVSDNQGNIATFVNSYTYAPVPPRRNAVIYPAGQDFNSIAAAANNDPQHFFGPPRAPQRRRIERPSYHGQQPGPERRIPCPPRGRRRRAPLRSPPRRPQSSSDHRRHPRARRPDWKQLRLQPDRTGQWVRILALGGGLAGASEAAAHGCDEAELRGRAGDPTRGDERLRAHGRGACPGAHRGALECHHPRRRESLRTSPSRSGWSQR